MDNGGPFYSVDLAKMMPTTAYCHNEESDRKKRRDSVWPLFEVLQGAVKCFSSAP
jgi:hypothetical protein